MVGTITEEESSRELGHNLGALTVRQAVRVVLLDQDDKVAIIYASKHGYYKIPGGGVDLSESWEDAARREVTEEAGCDCEIIDKLETIQTEIPVWGILDISHGFLARVSGKKTSPNYEPWEVERGFQLIWFDSLNKATEHISKNVASEPGMQVLQTRDLTFLKLAKHKLES